MNILKPYRLLFLFLLIAPFLFCAASQASDRLSSACDLITAEQLSGILGEQFGTAKETQHFESKKKLTMSLCTYTAADESSPTSVTIMLRYHEPVDDLQAEAQAHMASIRNAIQDQSYAFEEVQDLGGAALYDPQVNQLTVFEKDRQMIFQFPPQWKKDELFKVAAAVLSR